MMPNPYGRCPWCGAKFAHADRAGRRRSYCAEPCRRNAQRSRDGRGTPPALPSDPLARPIAEDLHQQVNRLLQGEYDGWPLGRRLEAARQMSDELDHYAAAAVADARLRDGATWKEIADAALCRPGTARNRWRLTEVQRRLARRTAARNEAIAPGQTRSAPPVMPRRMTTTPAAGMARREASGSAIPGSARLLAEALSQLHRQSGKTISGLSREIGVSPSYVSRVLSGQRLPSWPVTGHLARSCGGEPGELRALWESARGIRMPDQAGAQAGPVFRAALRGLYLAAGRPALEHLRASSHGVLTTQVLQDLVEGGCPPDWATVGRFVALLEGQPADIRPLWDAARFAGWQQPRTGPRPGGGMQPPLEAAAFGRRPLWPQR